jgi:hypothetical protein
MKSNISKYYWWLHRFYLGVCGGNYDNMIVALYYPLKSKVYHIILYGFGLYIFKKCQNRNELDDAALTTKCQMRIVHEMLPV